VLLVVLGRRADADTVLRAETEVPQKRKRPGDGAAAGRVAF